MTRFPSWLIFALVPAAYPARPASAQTPPPETLSFLTPGAGEDLAPVFVPGAAGNRGAPSATEQGTSGSQLQMTSTDFMSALKGGFGFTTVINQDTQTLALPLPAPFWSWIGWDGWFTSLNVPYIFRNFEADHRTIVDSGLGDMSLSTGAEWQLLGLNLTTSGRVKFPTGDWKNEDNGVPVPFGTGNFEYGVFQDLAVDFTAARFFTTFGFEYKPARSLTFSYEGQGRARFRIDNGEVFHYIVGGSIPIHEHWVHWYAKLGGQLIENGHFSIVTQRFRADDGLFTVDFLTGIHVFLTEDWWFFSRGAGFKFGVVMPLYTAADSSEPGAERRSLGVELGIISEFAF